MISNDLIDNIMSWEGGAMTGEDEVTFSQGLIDSGLCWELQGCYGRQAERLIQAGLCHRKEGP